MELAVMVVTEILAEVDISWKLAGSGGFGGGDDAFGSPSSNALDGGGSLLKMPKNHCGVWQTFSILNRFP